MNKIVYLLTFSLIAFIFIGCGPSIYLLQSNWQDKPVTVDGRATEWTIPLQYYDNDTKLNYTISNDDSTLYYCFRIGDDKEQMRVMRAGMQFWIDTTGKNQQQVGIQFPFPQLSAMSAGGNSSGGNHSRNGGARSDTGNMHKWTGKSNEMRLTGFKYPIGGVTPIPNIYGIKVSIARDSTGVIIYEAAIPFKTFYRPLTEADNNKMMGINIILNAMQPSSSGHSGGGGGHHGGGGMSGGGGMGGGMRGGGMGGGRGGSGRSQEEGENDRTTSTATLKLMLKLSVK